MLVDAVLARPGGHRLLCSCCYGQDGGESKTHDRGFHDEAAAVGELAATVKVLWEWRGCGCVGGGLRWWWVMFAVRGEGVGRKPVESL